MSVKLLMTWDIRPDNEQNYFEFVIREFIPGTQHIGLEPLEAWATVYGSYPQIQVALRAPDLASMQVALHTGEWLELKDKLLGFVNNFSQKIVADKRGFQF